MIARRMFLAGFCAAAFVAVGCGGGDDGGGGTTTPSIACTDGGTVPADTVSPTCGSEPNAQTQNVDVMMSGPASGTTTLRGLNFDLTYDPVKLDFVPAASYTSPLFPNALIAVGLENGLPGRVVVSIQTTQPDPDVSVSAGEHLALTLAFSRAAGQSFTPTPIAIENSETTPTGLGVTFESDVALSYP
jgi:hypothetical protein